MGKDIGVPTPSPVGWNLLLKLPMTSAANEDKGYGYIWYVHYTSLCKADASFILNWLMTIDV